MDERDFADMDNEWLDDPRSFDLSGGSMMEGDYHCPECNWVGDDPDINRDGDAYDPRTEWWITCPRCGAEVEETNE